MTIENFSITHKLGCSRHSLDNCILIKATVEDIKNVVRQYFGLEVRSHCQIADYINENKASWLEVERQRKIWRSRPKKSLPPILWAVPFWRYLDLQWSILPCSGTEESIAFALSQLLKTDVITFHDSKYACCSEFKVFRNDKLIERYIFGLECGADTIDDWDVKIEDAEFDGWNNYEHRFKSSVRQVTESKLRAEFAAGRHDFYDRGFLDTCLKYYKAYIPLEEETPCHYRDRCSSDLHRWDSIVARMDMAIVPDDWCYYQKVPDRII